MGGRGNCRGLHVNSFSLGYRFQAIRVTILAASFIDIEKTDSKIYIEMYKRVKEPIDWRRGENEVRGFTLFDFKTAVQHQLPTVIEAVQDWLKGRQTDQ